MRGTCLVRWTLLLSVCAGSLAAQAPQVNALLNGASFDQSAQAPPVAPGSIVSIFGLALAGTASTPVSMDASMNIPLETSLGGPSRASALSPVSVSFDGVNAPLFALIRTATFDQINAQIPWGVDVTDGKVQVVVTRDGQAGPAVEFPAADASPGIFTLQFGPGPAIVTNVAFAGGPAVVNGSFAQPQGSVCTTLGLPPGCGVADEPSPVGGAVTIWSNGLGPVDVQVASGNIPTTVGPGGFVAAVKPVRVFIGGVQAQVIGAALHSQFVALNQINVIVPNVPAGNAVPVRIEMDLSPGGTVRSRGDATIAVRAAP